MPDSTIVERIPQAEAPTAAIPIDLRRPSGRLSCASLARHVLHVVLPCTEKEMIRANTAPIVAVMADVQTIGNRPVGERVGKAMRVLPCATDSEDAIAVGGYVLLPFPTAVALLHACPEALRHRWVRLTRWGEVAWCIAV